MTKKKFEDSFVKISGLIGGDDYVRVAKSLLSHENTTDEEIAESTELKINLVRKCLYDLFGRSLITGIRVRDTKRGWFVYRWKAQRDQVEPFVESQKSKAITRLTQRLNFEAEHEFYHCGNHDCNRVTFEDALDLFFKCPSCGAVLNLKANDKAKKYFSKKIDHLKQDIRN